MTAAELVFARALADSPVNRRIAYLVSEGWTRDEAVALVIAEVLGDVT